MMCHSLYLLCIQVFFSQPIYFIIPFLWVLTTSTGWELFALKEASPTGWISSYEVEFAVIQISLQIRFYIIHELVLHPPKDSYVKSLILEMIPWDWWASGITLGNRVDALKRNCGAIHSLGSLPSVMMYYTQQRPSQWIQLILDCLLIFFLLFPQLLYLGFHYISPG